jgi:hypothetical protein
VVLAWLIGPIWLGVQCFVFLTNKKSSNMEMVQLQWNFRKRDPASFTLFISLLGLDFFLEQSRLQMFVHRIFTEGIFSSQYLTNELQL